MEYGCNLWLKGLSILCPPTTNFFFEIPQCAKHVIFICEYDNFGKNSPFYGIKIVIEIAHGEISKKKKILHHFSSSF